MTARQEAGPTLAARSRRTAAPGLHYTDSGPADAALTVLLLHSLGTDHRIWAPQRLVIARDHRVLAADARGHGRSHWHAPIDRAAWDDDLDRVLDDAGAEQAVLVGLSMGGVQALSYAQSRPDRVAGLVLADTFAELAPAAAEAKVAALAGAARTEGMAALAASYLADTFTIDPHPPGAEDVRSAIAGADPAAYAESAHACFTARLASGLGAITAPTTVLWGERDAKTPRALSEALCTGIRGAGLVTLPGAGHLSNLEAPEAFTAAVTAFLARLGTAGDRQDRTNEGR